MSWYRLYKKAQSDLDYGAWISPSGEVIKVSDYGHRKTGQEILEKRHNIHPDLKMRSEYDAIYMPLFDLGYARFVYISFNAQFKRLTHSQKKKLGGIIQQSQSTSFTFENMDDHSKDGQAFNKIEAMRILRAI